MGTLTTMTSLVPKSFHFSTQLPSSHHSHKKLKSTKLFNSFLRTESRFFSNVKLSTRQKLPPNRRIRQHPTIYASQRDGPTIQDEGIAAVGDTIESKGYEPAGGDFVVKERERAGEEVRLEMEKVGDVVRPKRIAFEYGFQAKFLRSGPTVPRNVVTLAFENFGREWRALRRSVLFADLKRIDLFTLRGPVQVVTAYTGRGLLVLLRRLDKFLTASNALSELKPLEEKGENLEQDELRRALKKLNLSNKAVWDRERSRPPVEAPWWILGPYYLLCVMDSYNCIKVCSLLFLTQMLDVIFKDRPIQRFWFLETVARMPYFSYISMLHLYETLGWWRVGAEVRKVHFAEEWNEMHHLKIMESLGGDLEWGDRFFGQHAAFFYYWLHPLPGGDQVSVEYRHLVTATDDDLMILNGMFLISPKVAYNFSELIEMHAVDTYGEFLDENEELLKTLPPSPVAVDYYESDDLYMFDEFQTSQMPESRRPKVDSLYDVFVAIVGDESEHVKTMAACQVLDTTILSPHVRARTRK